MPKNKSPDKTRLILASESKARRAMLENAGLQFEVYGAYLDEEEIIAGLLEKETPPIEIAKDLAEKKALAVSKAYPDAYVIGCDQILEFDGEIITRAPSVAEAKKILKKIQGKTHRLVSAVAIVKAQTTFWQHEDEATLTMHALDDKFLQLYCEKAGTALTQSVGGYQIESLGAWLFSEVRGDYFTILGLPLLPLLSYLREYHEVGL